MLPGKNPYDKPEVTLEESGNTTKNDYSIKITKIPDDIIIIKADEFSSPDTFFQGDNGECKRADFILIAQTYKKNWILHIEMKSGKDGNANMIKQLKGAQCLVAYCRAIGRTFWKEPKFLEEKNYEQRFVTITNITPRISKKTTRILPKSDWHDTPEKMWRIDSPGRSRLQFDKLVGKPYR